MSDDYLWDRSGPPDPEIEHLERVLAPLAHRGGFRVPRARPARRWWGAVAAALLVAIAAWQLTIHPWTKTPWQVAGAPVYAGLVIRTPSGGSLTLQADELGRVELAPDSELRVDTHARMTLPHGSVHVLIWAPPGRFVVDTPSARAIDLGCQYTLSVDAAGAGLLRVETGWVAFQVRGRESFIPAGAACRTSRAAGPGTPYFEDAPAPFRAALLDYDRGETSALARLLADARPRDGLTLWHLLARAGDADRGAVFDRFAQLVALPSAVTRAGVLARNSRMLDLCWDALGLENTGWWRTWKRPWPQP